MERGNEWSVRVTRGIGKRVAYYRARADLTAAMLSARCGELGLPVDRNVIAKLENGHRNSVTVDEVIVLAAALEVPPLLLLFGVGTEEENELFPGEMRHPFRAALWFTGEAASPARGAPDGSAPAPVVGPDRTGAGRILTLYREHDRAFRAEMEAMIAAGHIEGQITAALTGPQQEALRAAATAMLEAARRARAAADEIRARVQVEGMIPPEVPLGVFAEDAGFLSAAGPEGGEPYA